MDGWVDVWIDGCYYVSKDCLQQSKICWGSIFYESVSGLTDSPHP